MMGPYQAILLGIVEGLTEFLPVSSTGHLILTSHALGLQGTAVDTFEIVIQGGALAAVLGLYRKHVAAMVQGLFRRNPTGSRLLVNLLISFLPAAFLGLLFHKVIKTHLFGPGPVIAALAVGGVFMIVVDRWQKRRTGEMVDQVELLTRRQALLIGLAQCLALWPGTSRSMVTIVGGMLGGLSARTAAEYSFLLALPTLGAATLFDGALHAHELGAAMSPLVFGLGITTAGIVAALAIKGFVRYLGSHGLEVFGWYRIALSGVLLWMGAR